MKRKASREAGHALPDELWHFANTSPIYLAFHGDIRHEDADSLRRFLFATLDEVRLHWAERYANRVLEETDVEDAHHFRQGVLRREASGDIEYQKHRDHAAHTLHNYLLGWYICGKSRLFRDEMWRAIDLRMPAIRGRRFHLRPQRFGDVWAYVSLLHDVGYLFEGGLDALRVGSHSDRVRLGAEIAEEYFRNRFWIETPLAAATDRDRVRQWTGISEPKFAPYTVTAVGDALRTLGNLETLWTCVREELKEHGLETRKIAALDFRGQADAFKLWQQHYSVYSPSMVNRIAQMQTAFYALMWDGLPGTGLRLLDHGVAGGLLLLLFATYYFQMHYGIVGKAKDPKCDPGIQNDIRDLAARINERIRRDGVDYNAYWWWLSAVWATAATALHNLQQQDPPWPGCTETIEPLAMQEDPLAYLGILADILQEWDRYTVSRTSIFTGDLPLQGKDVRLSTDKGIVRIHYRDPRRAKRVRAALNTALKGWEEIVAVLPT